MQFFCNLFSFIVVVVIVVGVVFVVVVVVVDLDIKPMGAYCYKISRLMVTDINGENGWITPIPLRYDLVN